jgi:hypothetical protein
MKFFQDKDYSIRADSGVLIRVKGMRSYEVELEGTILSVPIDYSGGDIGYVNIWVQGIEGKSRGSTISLPDNVIATAVETLTQYLLSTSARVCVRWSPENKQFYEPKRVPFKVWLGDRIARLYWPRGRK